jgi:hypothetical protein
LATDFSWGILGTGSSAAQFITSLQRGGRHIAGVAGKSFSEAIAFATQNAIMRAMLNPQQLLANQQIDAVYFDNDFASNEVLIKKALQYGKHVLLQELSEQNTGWLAGLKKLAQHYNLQLAVLNPLLTMPLVEKMTNLLAQQQVAQLTMYIAPDQNPVKYARVFCSWLSTLLPGANLKLVDSKKLLFKGPQAQARIASSTEPSLIEKLLVKTKANVYLLDSALVPLSLKINGGEPTLIGEAKLAQFYFIEEFEKLAGKSYELLARQEQVFSLLKQLL